MVLTHDAIVLAGGTGLRLGGVSKPEVLLHGRRLLDHALAATTRARRVVVVAPGTVPVPDGVLQTLEDPPHGGPVAGIGAGLAALDRHGGASADGEPPVAGPPLTLVLACDVPGAVRAVPRVLDRVRDAVGGDVGDAVVVEDADGRAQWLVGMYRTEVLRKQLAVLDATGGLHGCPVHKLVRSMRLTTVPVEGRDAADIDTWDDLEGARSRGENQ